MFLFEQMHDGYDDDDDDDDDDDWCDRISAILSCPMKLQKYPLDTQKCPMMFESCELSLCLPLHPRIPIYHMLVGFLLKFFVHFWSIR